MANTVTTLEDVANLAGVSKSTASRILGAGKGSKLPFASETRDRVQNAAAKLGYKPSKLARGLTLSKTGFVGLVMPSLTDSFFPAVASAIETRLAENGYSVILANTNSDSRIERTKIEDLLSWQVDGLIVAPAQKNGDAGPFWELWQREIPFVLVDRTFPQTPFASVTTADDVGAAMVVEHLIATGHTRIARVGGSLEISTNRLRHSSYITALINHGIVPNPDYAVDVLSSEEGGHAALGRILDMNPPPDAVFCLSDFVAIGILEACRDRGIRVPEDLAVVGYTDLPHCSLLKVSLTTVRQPRQRLGYRAAEMLVACMDKSGEPEQVILPVELIVRESTARSATVCSPGQDEEPPRHNKGQKATGGNCHDAA